jgi:hypothetical protein
MENRNVIPAASPPSTQPVNRPMSRWRAAGIHLLISAGIAASMLTLMLFVWYPPPLFEAMGGVGLALLLIGVDVVLGPSLTLVVFRSGKRGLKLDLALIGLCQFAALVYGCYVVSLARPAFIVFVKDQFQVATVTELEPKALAEAKYPEFRSPPWTGPVWVYGVFPTDKKERDDLMFSGLAGVDMQHFPKYYAPYEQGTAQIIAAGVPLPDVHKIEPEIAKLIDAWVASAGANPDRLRYLPLRGRVAWIAVLIDRDTGRPVKLMISEKL